MPEATVTCGDADTPLTIRINGVDPTFVLGTDRLRARTGVAIGQREQDLLEIAATVFAADGSLRDTTQRSRSFLFAALGQAVARAFSARQVSFFENGVISHNLPLGRQIVGTMATRTTHPQSLRLLNELCALALEDCVAIDNPYQWLTKTEVVRRIAENGGHGQIMRAVSCTSIRQQDSVRTHCGACSQCLDRRFAIVAAGLEDHEAPEIYETDIFTGAREATASRTMAVDWTRRMIAYATMTPDGLMREVGTEIGRIARGHPGLSTADVVRRTLDMHQRQAECVAVVLAEMIGREADSIARGHLPATSLLVLYAGQAGQSACAEPAPIRAASLPIDRAAFGEDILPDPAAPLRVAFLREGDQDIVAIEGYCRLTGQVARIPVMLLPDLLQGRADDLAVDVYPWTKAGRLADAIGFSKDALRQNVTRLRKQISESYAAIHGVAPGSDLLVQTRRSRGYRLDPDIEYLGRSEG